MSKKQKWVIIVGNDYGTFMFEGTEEEAEQRRRDKANWEGAVALKRLADENEIKSNEPEYCWNHPNFASKVKHYCECEKCKGD